MAPFRVALRKESVDRNYNATSNPVNKLVALRKESVDRNIIEVHTDGTISVALRKESVDRNLNAGSLDRDADGRSPQGERG